MSVEGNRAIVRRIVEEVLDKGNLAAIPELFAPNWVYHISSTQELRGYEGLKQVVVSNKTAFPDSRVTVDDLVAEGDKVVCRYTITGTHKGVLSGIPPTTKNVTYAGMFIDLLEGGKVIETWGIQDQLSMFRQLGVTPPGFEVAKK